MEVYIFSLRIEFTRTLYDHLERRRAVASLRGAPRVTPFRGYVTPEGKKLWANLQRIVEKRGRTGKNGVGWHWCDTDTRVKAIKSDSDSDSNEQKKKKRSSVFEKKKQGVTPQNWRLKKVARFFRKKIDGCHPQLPPRVSPTLVTPLAERVRVVEYMVTVVC